MQTIIALTRSTDRQLLARFCLWPWSQTDTNQTQELLGYGSRSSVLVDALQRQAMLAEAQMHPQALV